MATISLPDDLKSVWKRIPRKSAWVAQHLRELGGWVEESTHTSWSSAIGMCNMYHVDGPCRTCMADLNMIEYDAIEEYERRSRIVRAIDDGWADVKDWEVEEE